MKEKLYIAVIVVLAALSMFLVMTHRRDCRMLRDAGPQCMSAEQGMRGRGPGMGMGKGMSGEAQSARDTLFNLIKAGSADTTLIFSKLEGVVNVQRENQKQAIRRILTMRDSLSGAEREVFLQKIDERFCKKQGMRGQGRGAGRDGGVTPLPCP